MYVYVYIHCNIDDNDRKSYLFGFEGCKNGNTKKYISVNWSSIILIITCYTL